MINMLSFSNADNVDEDQLLDEATLPSGQLSDTDLAEYYDRLINIFPDACLSHIMDLCHEQMKSGCINLDTLVDAMITCKLQDAKEISRNNFKYVVLLKTNNNKNTMYIQG